MDTSTPHQIYDNPRVEDVVGSMVKFAHGAQGKENLALRDLCERIIADVESGDYAGEANALYHWVCRKIRYVRDPTGVEFVRSPVQTLKAGTGDCDDIATLLAAMLMAIGNKCRFILVGFQPKPAPATHVFAAVVLPDGSAVPLDPVANRVTGQMLARATAVGNVKVIDLGDFADDGGDEPNADLGYEHGRGELERLAPVPRTYSVWDYGAKQYTYYSALSAPPPPTGGFRRPRIRARTPESITAKLPASATKTGAGTKAKGTIATIGSLSDLLNGSGSAIGLPRAVLYVGGGAAVVGAAWWLWRRRKHKRSRARRRAA